MSQDSGREERRARLLKSFRDSGEVLVEETRPQLARRARSRGLDPSAANDVVQVAYTALVEAQPAQLVDVEGWLHRLVSWRSADWRRQERCRREATARAAAELAPPSSLPPELFFALHSVLDQLSPRHRLLVGLRYFEGYSAEEAARAAGYSVASFNKTMTRILAKLRRALSDDGPDESRKAR